MTTMTANQLNTARPLCYQWQDKIIKATDLHSHAKLIGLLLVNYMNKEKNYCYPSLTRLAHESSLTKKTVIKYLQVLAKAGYLSVKKRIIDGGYASNIYQLIAKKDYKTLHNNAPIEKEKLGGVVYDIHQGGISATPGVVYDVHPNNQLNKQMNNQLKTNTAREKQKRLNFDDEQLNTKHTKDGEEKDYIKRFELFWNAYPKKVARKKALESFKRINPDQSLFKKIMFGLNQVNALVWRHTEQRFIPNASTWLNQERWSDELTASRMNPPQNKKSADTFAEAVKKYMNNDNGMSSERIINGN